MKKYIYFTPEERDTLRAAAEVLKEYSEITKGADSVKARAAAAKIADILSDEGTKTA